MTANTNEGGRKSSMLIPTILMGALAAALVLTAYLKKDASHITGLKSALTMTIEMLPVIIFALIIAGMIPALIPKDFITKWVGSESGFRGILIGSIVGGFTPGGPYVSLPIMLGIMKSGASIGTLVAFMTGWSLISFARLPMDIGILGWKFTLIRLACVFFFAPIAGLIAQLLFSGVKLD